MAGAESKQWLSDLTKQIDRLEALLDKAADVVGNDKPERKVGKSPALAAGYGDAFKGAGSVGDDEEDDEFAPGKVPSNGFDEDEEETVEVPVAEEDAPEESDEVEEDFDAPPVKAKGKGKAKAKKFTSNDCNDAAKAAVKIFTPSLGAKAARDKVLAIMKKKFKIDSVLALKPEQYESFIASMEVSQ